MTLNVEPDEESRPLLVQSRSSLPVEGREDSARRRGNSVSSLLARGRSNTINSLKSSYETVKRHKTTFSFTLLACLLIYVTFILAFLPNTSLSRDFRRLHFSKLTKDEAYRIYIHTLLVDNKAKEHSRNFSTHLNLAGEQGSLQYMTKQLCALGYNPNVVTYSSWLNRPEEVAVTLLVNGKVVHDAKTVEDKLSSDYTARGAKPAVGFHGYSANGDVSAKYVFCNYGTVEDYQHLLKHDVDLKGKVHIIRYSKIAAGLKVRNAESYGAVGVIIYTDSFDDGHITVANGFKAYPDGPARNSNSIQRDSVLYFSDMPGVDGRAEDLELVKAQEGNKGERAPTIPSVPLSEREIGPILEKLNGKGIRFENKGNVKGFEYYSGPSEEGVIVHVKNKQDYQNRKINNIIIEIPGIFSDNEVIIGSRRDSWSIGGASSPNSGSAVLLEVARGLSALRLKGWKPLRTIKLISWDGGAYGMVGSTFYGMDHKGLIQSRTLAYLNLDTAVSGSAFRCSAHPLLNDVFTEAARFTVYKGEIGVSLYDYWKKISDASIDPLGGGSDFAVFHNHIGVPCGNLMFERKEDSDAICPCNSNYDTTLWMEEFGDPGYQLHNTLAHVMGLSALMLAENELVPFNTHDFMKEIWNSYGVLQKHIKAVFSGEDELLALSDALFDQLQLATFHTSASFDEKAQLLRRETTVEYPWWRFHKKLGIYSRLVDTNAKLKKLNRVFLTKEGLKDRPWMRHSLFAPHKQVGYTADILPGLNEALEAGDKHQAALWLQILSTQLDRVISLLTV